MPSSSTSSTTCSSRCASRGSREAIRRVVDAGGAPGEPDDDAIPVELGGVTRFVRRSEVRYVEAQGDYTRLHTPAGQPADPGPAGDPRGGVGRRRLRPHPPLAPRRARPRQRGPHRRRPRHRRRRRRGADGLPPAHPRAARPPRPPVAGRARAAGHEPPGRPAATGPRHQPPHLRRPRPAGPAHRRDRPPHPARRDLRLLAAAGPAPARRRGARRGRRRCWPGSRCSSGSSRALSRA